MATWPRDYGAWRLALPIFPLFQRTQGYLRGYRILRENMGFLSPDIFRACEHALDRAELHRQFPGFFVSEMAFRLWVREVAMREARRHILTPPDVQACLQQLPPHDQQLLYWYFVEGFPFRTFGQVLCGTSPAWEATARAQVQNALNGFVAILMHNGWGDGEWTFPR